MGSEAYDCIETFYRGLELNSSIQNLEIDMDLFPSRGAFPTFNLRDAQFKETLETLIILDSNDHIGNHQSFMLSSALENMSLKFFDIRRRFFENYSAFRRIVLACLRVERLELSCDGINQYAAVLADLIGNSTSNLPSLVFYGSTHDGTLGEEELSSIAASLLGNTRLKLLRMMTPVSCDSMSSIATALCNTSSIGAICNSNHTLKFIRNGRSANCYDVDCYENVPHLLVGYLKMNALRNKHVM